jgi:hypothetical protein
MLWYLVSLAGVPKVISSWWSYQVFWWHAVGEERGASGNVITKNGTAIRKTIHRGFLIKQLIACHCFDQYVSEKSLSVSLSIQKSHTCAPGHSIRPTPTRLDTVPDQHLYTWSHYQTYHYTPGHMPDPHLYTWTHTRPTLIHPGTYRPTHIWTLYKIHPYTPGHTTGPTPEQSFLTCCFSATRKYKIFCEDESSEGYAQIQ